MDDMDPVITPFMVPPTNGDAATIEYLANNKSKKNLGLRVQPGGQCTLQLGKRKENVEEWAGKVKTGHLPTRAVWQSYTQQLWSNMKYGLGACTVTLKELENGLGLTDFYLISKLGVA